MISLVRHCIIKPAKAEDSILFSDKELDELAVEIITEFYKSVGKDKPEWLDSTFKQRSIMEENTEQAYFEIRNFLVETITNAFSRNFRSFNYASAQTIEDENIVPNNAGLLVRLNFCLDNDIIPFLHKHGRKDGIDEIIISHDILIENLTKET